MNGWGFTDAWVLASVGGYGRPCNLAELVAAADRINQSIVSEDQLAGALGRLAGAGLLRVFDDWTAELTDDGIMLWSVEGRDLPERLKEVEHQLANFEPGGTEVTLPRGAFTAAVEEYQSW